MESEKVKEIKKVLEICQKDIRGKCKDCPYEGRECDLIISRNSLTLINELEKENERLTNVTPYQVVISDDKFEELKKNAFEDFNLTKIMLKQFAERLIEKEIKQGGKGLDSYDISETLKEFIDD